METRPSVAPSPHTHLSNIEKMMDNPGQQINEIEKALFGSEEQAQPSVKVDVKAVDPKAVDVATTVKLTVVVPPVVPEIVPVKEKAEAEARAQAVSDQESPVIVSGKPLEGIELFGFSYEEQIQSFISKAKKIVLSLTEDPQKKKVTIDDLKKVAEQQNINKHIYKVYEQMLILQKRKGDLEANCHKIVVLEACIESLVDLDLGHIEAAKNACGKYNDPESMSGKSQKYFGMKLFGAQAQEKAYTKTAQMVLDSELLIKSFKAKPNTRKFN